MFDPDSRYARLPTATYLTREGREIVYATRRFLPRAKDLAIIARVGVTASDRMDLIAARTIGDPLQYGQICDANEAMNPEELVETAGRILLVATPV